MFHLLITIWIIWSSILTLTTLSNSVELAKKFYDDAFYYIDQNDIERAIASFRTAVRLDNASYLYWNDLGVTEMRIGQLQKAYDRYQRANRLLPEYDITLKNIRQLEDYISNNPNITEKRKKEIIRPSSHQKTPPRNQKHTIKQIPTYSSSEFTQLLYSLQSSNQYLQLLSKPFIVRKYIDISKNYLDYLDFSSLKLKYNNVKVDFYPHNMLQEQTRPFFKSINQALDQLIKPSEAYIGVDISLPGSYIQWNLLPKHYQQLLTEMNISLPFIFNDGYLLQSNTLCFEEPHVDTLLAQFYLNTHWKMFLIGEEGAGMFNHQDTLLSPTWQLLLTGIKQWHLCPNSQSSYLYKAGEVNLFAPNYEDYPNVLKIKCYQFNQTKGDLLYYPGNYWHQTMNFETPTIGITGTFITKTSVRDLIKELRKECDGANRLFAKDLIFCNQLSRCFESWERILLHSEDWKEHVKHAVAILDKVHSEF